MSVWTPTPPPSRPPSHSVRCPKRRCLQEFIKVFLVLHTDVRDRKPSRQILWGRRSFNLILVVSVRTTTLGTGVFRRVPDSRNSVHPPLDGIPVFRATGTGSSDQWH